MNQREDPHGYVQIDESGRVFVHGVGLRKALGAMEGYYTHLPSDAALLHFQRAHSLATHDEFRDEVVFTGDISAMGSTIEVINFVTSSQMSGNLVFVSGDVRKCLFFKGGEIRGANSNRLEDRLGEVMHRYGALSREALDSALVESRRKRTPLGNYLLEKGMINQPDLFGFLRKQIEETFYSILLIREGDFYLTKYDVTTLNSPITLNAQSLLMEGLRRMDEMDYFEKRIPSRAHRIERAAGAAGPDESMGARASTLWRLLDAPTTLDALIRASRFGRFETTKQVFHLLERNQVAVLEPLTEGAQERQETDELEPGRLLDRFNAVFEAVNRAVGAEPGRFAAILGHFTDLYGFKELFADVGVEEDVRLAPAAVLANHRASGATKPEALSQPLNELLFFLLFSIRGQLHTVEREHVQRMVNRLYLDLG